MANTRMWLVHDKTGWAARLATGHGWGWDADCNENSLNDLFGKSEKAIILMAKGEYDAPSDTDEFIVVWEGDDGGWSYGETHPILSIRKIVFDFGQAERLIPKKTGEWEWKNVSSPPLGADPITGRPSHGYFYASLGKRWDDFWPYSTMDGILFKQSPDGWGHYQINSALQETTWTSRRKNEILWIITKLLGR